MPATGRKPSAVRREPDRFATTAQAPQQAARCDVVPFDQRATHVVADEGGGPTVARKNPPNAFERGTAPEGRPLAASSRLDEAQPELVGTRTDAACVLLQLEQVSGFRYM